MGKHRDWTEIRNDYQQNGLSYAKLADKYNVPIDTLKKAAAREGWTNRKERQEKLTGIKTRRAAKAVASVSEETAPDRNGTEETAPNPTDNDEALFARTVSGLLAKIWAAMEYAPLDDARALKSLSGALKDLATLKGWCKDELDREEQRARIEKLRADVRQATAGTEAENALRVVFVNTDGAEI